MLTFETWNLSNIILFIITILFFSAISVIYIINKIIDMHQGVESIYNHPLDIEKSKKILNLNLVNVKSFFKKIKKYNDEIKVLQFENRILYDTALAVYTSASLEELLDIILGRLTTHMNADFGLIFLLDGDELKLKSKSNISKKEVKKSKFRIGEGLVGWTVHKGQGILTTNVEVDYRYIRCIPNTKSQITIPIKIYERVLGVLVIGSYKSDYFNESNFKLLNTISGEIGLAINNAKLTEKLKKENEYNHTLFEMTKKITSSVNLNEVAKIGIKAITEVIEAELCVVAVYNEDSQALNVAASYEKTPYTKKTFQLEETIKQAICEKYPIGKQVTSGYLYSVPLLSDNNCIGVLHIKTKYVLQKEVFELITSIATPLSIALENALSYKSMESLAITDGLTGIYNHRYFQEILDKKVEYAQKYNQDLSLIMFDIDDFKKYNDKYGHPVADEVLKEISKIVKKNLREEDTAARYGGDEFMIILPNTKTEEAQVIMERIVNSIKTCKFKSNKNINNYNVKDSIEEKNKVNDIQKNVLKWFSNKKLFDKLNSFNNSLNVTISIGICSLVDVNFDKTKLIKYADQATLLSKKDGKNQVTIWSPVSE